MRCESIYFKTRARSCTTSRRRTNPDEEREKEERLIGQSVRGYINMQNDDKDGRSLTNSRRVPACEYGVGDIRSISGRWVCGATEHS